MILALPRPPTQREMLVMNAVKRGIPLPVVARGLGVSHQACQQALVRYEKFHGSVRLDDGPRKFLPAVAKKFWECEICGKCLDWVPASTREKFCSRKCSGLAKQIITESKTRTAIQMRHEGYLWKTIAKEFAVSVQAIQVSIWFFLQREGLFKTRIVAEIWSVRPSERRHSGRWKWLINNHGKAPV